MQEKYIRLLKVMLESNGEVLNSQELSEQIGISQRTVLRYIKEIKAEGDENVFRVETWKGRGYYLNVLDRAKFRELLNTDEDAADREVKEVLFRLLLEPTCKLDDLAEILHYSRAGMTRIVEKTQIELENHGFRLLNKPYIGFFISGNEIHIRNYLYQILEKQGIEELADVFAVSLERINAVRDYIGQELSKKSVKKYEDSELFFLKYLLIQHRRIRIRKTVRTDYFVNISQTAHLYSDMGVTRHIMEMLGMNLTSDADGKIENIYLALVYRQAFWQNGLTDTVDEKNLQFYQDLTARALQRIRANYHVDLIGDEILVNGLILHIASNFRRYLLGMETENLFYNDVLERYPTAYYYAMEVAEEISAWTKLSLSKYEISFLGMHFASYLERNLKEKQWKCAIICGSGAGSAQLLESRLMNKYPSLQVTATYSVEEVDRAKDNVDFYIVTFHPDEEIIKEKIWIQISPMFDIKEQIALEQLMGNLSGHNGWKQKGVPKYYLKIEHHMEKQILLEYICGRYVGEGLITQEEAEGILGREQLVSTEITEGIAMPHGLIGGNSFLVFVLLNNPVVWGRTKVSLVVLGCFRRGDERMKEELEYIFRLFLNEEKKEKLLLCRSAGEIREYMEDYYGK